MSTQQTCASRETGFSLIELMVAVVIIAILAATAYPSYISYVTNTRRADGMAGILRLASSLAKFKANCGQYTANILGGSPNQPACSGLSLGAGGNLSPDGNYLLTIVPTPDPNGSGALTGYTISAAPTNLHFQATRDTNCATLTYDQDGIKGNTGPKPPSFCWKQ